MMNFPERRSSSSVKKTSSLSEKLKTVNRVAASIAAAGITGKHQRGFAALFAGHRIVPVYAVNPVGGRIEIVVGLFKVDFGGQHQSYRQTDAQRQNFDSVVLSSFKKVPSGQGYISHAVKRLKFGERFVWVVIVGALIRCGSF